MLSASLKPTVLLQVHETLGNDKRSGVQRVVVKLARELAGRVNLQLVRWEAEEGSLRFCDRAEFDMLFGRCGWPSGLSPRLDARSLRRRFGDLLSDPAGTWLLQAEIPYNSEEGFQGFVTATTQAREYGVRTAAVAYDLIPISNPRYHEGRESHLRYLADLVRHDLLLPISHHSDRELSDFMCERGLDLPPTRAVLLAESDHERVFRAAGGSERTILMVGTVEPRKRQMDVLHAYARACQASPAVAVLPLVVVGGLHHAIAVAFTELAATIPGVVYRSHLSDQDLEAAWREAAFSVFASDDEGYGLPVAESVARGVPCLAADVAPITEIAGGAGVLHVDVTRIDAICAGLIELAEHPCRREALREAAAHRRLRTWGDYADDVVKAMMQTPARVEPPSVVRTAAVPARADTQAAASFALGGGASGEADGLLRRRSAAFAEVEASYGRACRVFGPCWAARPVVLRIVIPTFNQRSAVKRNVAWLLDEVVRDRSDLELMVADDASSDGTGEALEAFGGRRLRLVVQPTRLGVHRNIHECARRPGAEYVWVIGVDDLVEPTEIDPLLAALKGDALGVPLARLNLGFRKREPSISSAAPGRRRVPAEPPPPSVLPTGQYPVRVVAGQYDSATPPAAAGVWRSDVLATAYDRPFDARGAETLSERLPDVAFLLGSYGEAMCYWHERVAVKIGRPQDNTEHPAWLIREALQLANAAGVDRRALQAWERGMIGHAAFAWPQAGGEAA